MGRLSRDNTIFILLALRHTCIAFLNNFGIDRGDGSRVGETIQLIIAFMFWFTVCEEPVKHYATPNPHHQPHTHSTSFEVIPVHPTTKPT